MHRFRDILYLAGDDERSDGAFQRAVGLARINDARLTVVGSLTRTGDELREEFGVAATEVEALLTSRVRAGLEPFVESARAEGVEVEWEVLRGSPFLAVIHRVLARGHDLVMKTADGDRSLRARFFGSVDQHLMRKCPCPVWLLDPARVVPFASVLSAVDLTAGDEGLPAKVVQLGSSLARREGAEFHVVHAWSLYGETLLRSQRSGMSPDRVRQLLAERRTERRAQLEEVVAAEAGGTEARLHLEKGEATRVIEVVARRIRADVLIMGTVSRSGVPGLLIGNTAEAVLGRVQCSVLTVKPDGFETPVRLPEGMEEARPSRDRTGEPSGSPEEPPRTGVGR